MNFYVYKWFIKETGEIFYIGKGRKDRYKQIRKRNKKFLEVYSNNNCDTEIIEYFEKEEDAFKKEYELICHYKSIGQCYCNLDNGGKGGCNFVWTPEMREYYSKYNIMKSEKQRKRMSENNPMKNPVLRQKVTDKVSKTIIYGNERYKNAKELAQKNNLSTSLIYYWIKRGYGRNNIPCYYLEDGKKDFVIIEPKTNNKPVTIDEFYFKSVKMGASYINVSSNSLIDAMKHNRKCKGHICKYANQQPSYKNSDKSIVEGSTTNE